MIKDERKMMREINKVYKDLKIDKNVNDVSKTNSELAKRIGIYDNSKKSYLDNKTSVRTSIKAKCGYYGGLE